MFRCFQFIPRFTLLCNKTSIYNIYKTVSEINIIIFALLLMLLDSVELSSKIEWNVLKLKRFFCRQKIGWRYWNIFVIFICPEHIENHIRMPYRSRKRYNIVLNKLIQWTVETKWWQRVILTRLCWTNTFSFNSCDFMVWSKWYTR